MRQLQPTAWALSIVLALIVGISGCGGESPDGHAGHGVVVSLDADARKISLDHEDIPGFMKAMTMTFNLAPGIALVGIDAGTEVDFRVNEKGGVYTVTEIRRTGSPDGS